MKPNFYSLFMIIALGVACSKTTHDPVPDTNERSNDKPVPSEPQKPSSNSDVTPEDHLMPKIGPGNFVLIKAGGFSMGTSPDEIEHFRRLDLYEGRSPENEDPSRLIHISKDFEIGKFEVTQKEWFDVMEENPSHFVRSEHCPNDHQTVGSVDLCPNNPVDGVSWNDVQTFIVKLKEKGLGTFRLPTEAEWEFAARGGEGWTYPSKLYSFGNDKSQLVNYAWVISNSDRQTHPVGQKLPNDFGLFDMAGNVQEWVQDAMAPYSYDVPSDDPVVDVGLGRVMRGGNWDTRIYESACRVAARDFESPGSRIYTFGFRLVKVR